MGLRAIAHDVARGGTPTVLISDRLLALERIAARLANRRRRTAPATIRAPGRSGDRAAILSYLRGDPGDAAARTAAAAAAERHDWPWRERGRRWRLWEGPETLAATLRQAPDRTTVLRGAGLVGSLAAGGFAAAALAAADRRAKR